MERMVSRLLDGKKLEREAALAELQRAAPGLPPAEKATLVQQVTAPLERDSSASRDALIGCLGAARILAPHLANPAASLLPPALRLLKEHPTDLCIQTAAGELIGALAQKQGPQVYEDSKKQLLGMIRKGMENDPSNSQIEGDTADQILHADITCFGSLEAALRTIQGVAEACRGRMAPFVDIELLQLLNSALGHKIHSPREAAFYLAASLATSLAEAEKNSHEGLIHFGDVLASRLASGLADEWSPVRLAASVAVRRFLCALPDKSRKKFYHTLLPRMCLNRYYAAEGVRIYSQETWRQVTGALGRDLVIQNLPQVIDFYCESANAQCHAVREAACSCISEVASKLPPEAVRPFVHRLLDALLQAFDDDSWPVRDAACLACGSVASNFPKECESSLLTLFPLFYRNLEDVIPTVRAGAANALAGVARARGSPVLEQIFERALKGLQGLEKQPEDVFKENKQGVMCSMNPRMSRTGSMDHRFCRPSQPWEFADGCVMLFAELSMVPSATNTVAAALPKLAEACRLRHYSSHLTFLETVCKNLPTIAKGVGRKNFKQHLDEFFDPIFYALESENALTSSAASQCLNQLSSLIGPGVLRARVEANCPHHLKHLHANLFIAPY
ncbi:uncharacterized protein LOC132195063 [Neocloeon triangulifer]|uniref:uncharacterized protein LOC132195063 n=1 Tax=Neocloeon triangulifer TaxID=2078957 RepID=UPI00286F3635|nr:uncharacterized protein LOC132195063 [Neocloeon triangulifer]